MILCWTNYFHALSYAVRQMGSATKDWGGMIQLILLKIYISIFLSFYYRFSLMVIIVHNFMTYLTYLWHIYGYFVAKDKMFSINGGMIWADHVI